MCPPTNASRWAKFVHAWRNSFYRNSVIYCVVMVTIQTILQVTGRVYCGL